MSIATRAQESVPEWLAIVAAQVGQLRYGVVQIVVHDARVVQIERTEKVRLGSPGPDVASGALVRPDRDTGRPPAHNPSTNPFPTVTAEER